MLFERSEKAIDIQNRLSSFMDEHIFPSEKVIEEEKRSDDRWHVSQTVERLKAKARKAGLWNLFLPSESGLSNLEYAPLAELMGRVYWSAEVFNCSAPDTETWKFFICMEVKSKKKSTSIRF